ncbi:aminoacyl-tRNA deacylase [Marinobacterium aestuariivivens]|uniref:Aminoacyl-tRNA deacylase n=1 Tax=Marinobacterium aestuariivivens TaxID=1698799 RepID=A0ABW2A6I2_9GAMM
MPIAERLSHYLEQHNIDYETRTHTFTPSSARAAEAAHVPGHQLAKAVVLKRPDERFLLMVLPADFRVQLGQLHRLMGEEVCRRPKRNWSTCSPTVSRGRYRPWGMSTGCAPWWPKACSTSPRCLSNPAITRH